ncbi:hypothetical protein Afe04nite_83610 [Asanoa ferruginea]|uniref:hypothetical protein n=1 Tax=Asanoa ferruginea TaxID=53367 RepID=UPI0019408A9A|nr:hypothetical protein [Asanoa ferruginea]GIF53822.1 hypothetical protein Afe04nite_83610 [Asanoa ferruginea]
MLTRRRLLTYGVLLGVLLALAAVLLVRCAAEDDPVATDDPADARNIALALVVTPDQVGLVSAELGTGVAASRPLSRNGLRVRLLDARDREIDVLTVPDPLERRVYAPPGGTRLHSNDRADRASVTVHLALDARASTAEVSWAKGPAHRFDLVAAIRAACRDDRHRDCANWLAQHR